MFDVYCERHAARVLLPASRIDAMRNLPSGIEVTFRCYCGAQGSWRTGRAHRHETELAGTTAA